MTSTLKLYFNSRISPRKNFIIDSLSSYLATLDDTITLSDFQYIKHALTLEIKIDLDQEYLGYLNTDALDYVSIQNSDQTNIVYYFVMNKKWRGQSTIALTLSMDTINSFKLGTDYSFDDKTKINRQHKDRFLSNNLRGNWTTGTITEFVNYKEYRINGQLANFTIGELWTLTGGTMYLNIRKAATGNPLIERHRINNITFFSGYFVASYNNQEVYSINLSDYASATFWLSVSVYNVDCDHGVEDNFDATITFVESQAYRKIDLTSEGVTPILYGKNESILEGDGQNWYLVYKGSAPIRCYICADNRFDITLSADASIVATDLAVGYYYYILPNENASYVSVTTNEGVSVSALIQDIDDQGNREQYVTCFYRDGANIKVLRYRYLDIGLGFFYVSTGTTFTTTSITLNCSLNRVLYRQLGTQTSNTATIRTGTSSTKALTQSTYTNRSFSEIGRSDADLVKIIKLPYKPFNSAFGLKYDNDTMKLIYVDNLDVTLDYNLTSEFNPLQDIVVNISSISAAQLRNPLYESKLYHSDYYQPKFVYDSFSFVFALERINLDNFLYTTEFNLTFSVTNTINSKMLFTFPTYVVDGLALEDYSNVLYVARSNEVTILNSSYMDYLKLGYNYDVKVKERQEVGQWVGFGLTTAGAIASFAVTGVTAGVSAAAGISLATSAMAQLVGAVNTTAQAEAAQSQKLFQLKQQRSSVFGADDVDLMTRYTGNKAKFMTYKCSEKMQSVLFDLFFYTGYIDGRLGVPDLETRTRFNFVSCEPVFNVKKNIPEDILNDIELKFNAGVTAIHYYNSEWDLDQKYENWEVSLFQEVNI